MIKTKEILCRKCKFFDAFYFRSPVSYYLSGVGYCLANSTIVEKTLNCQKYQSHKPRLHVSVSRIDIAIDDINVLKKFFVQL